MKPPRRVQVELGELPEYEADRFATGDDFEGVRLTFPTDEPVLTRSTLREVELSGSVLASLETREARLTDVAGRRLGVGAWQSAGARWSRVHLEGGRLGSLDLTGATLDGIRFEGLRIGYLTLAQAALVDVAFVDCEFETLDLPAATCQRVAFEGCRAAELDVRHALFNDTDLRGLAFDGLEGVDALRGATVSGAQAVQLAERLAEAAGIAVAD